MIECFTPSYYYPYSSKSSTYYGSSNNNVKTVSNKKRIRITSSPSATHSKLYMGMDVNKRIVGKQKKSTNKQSSENWLEDAYHMYIKRLQNSSINAITTWHKNDNGLLKGISNDKTKGYSIILLDPTGKIQTSEEFSSNFYNWLEIGGSRLVFVIGGSDGLPSELKQGIYYNDKKNNNNNDNNSYKYLSLSSLTFTHQFSRVILIEQIYRAYEIRKGSAYHNNI